MRHHGWELPYHPLQVVAIAVFFALGFAFYVFFAPFVGSKVSELHIIVLYSPLAFAVLVLYIQCAAANPADPGVLRCLKSFDLKKKTCSVDHSSTTGQGDTNKDLEQGGVLDMQRHDLAGKAGGAVQKSWKASCFSFMGGLFPGAQLIRSPCRGTGVLPERCTPEEDLLFCTLCKVEVCKYSKHCRACDKCVDGFDHHCRWLNNCVGRKNYKRFIALIVTGLLLLAIQWIVGVAVLVRCFLHRKAFDVEIVRNLGSSFSWVPFIIIVGICTVLALSATLPLGQLFFFHMILIKKGIGTYDYVVAIREQEQLQAVDDEQSQFSSPSSSTTISGSGFLGTLQKGVICTPPRILEDQESIISSVGIPNVGISSAIPPAIKSQKGHTGSKIKRSVKISPWKLAHLNELDASKAAARIRESSSILHPTERTKDSGGAVDTARRTGNTLSSAPKEELPFSTSRGRGNLSNGLWKADDQFGDGFRTHLEFPGIQGEVPSAVRLNPSIKKMCLHPLERGEVSPDIHPLAGAMSCALGALNLGASSSSSTFAGPGFQRSKSDGYEASGGESTDDSDHVKRLGHAWSKLKFNPRDADRVTLKSRQSDESVESGNKGSNSSMLSRASKGLGKTKEIISSPSQSDSP